MLARKPKMLVVVALANRTARVVWALTTRKQVYRGSCCRLTSQKEGGKADKRSRDVGRTQEPVKANGPAANESCIKRPDIPQYLFRLPPTRSEAGLVHQGESTYERFHRTLLEERLRIKGPTT